MSAPNIKGALLTLLIALPALAQNPVSWSLTSDATKAAPGSTILLKLTATIDEGWHVYALQTPAGLPSTVGLAENPAIASSKIYQPKPDRKYDPNFKAETATYEKAAVFLIPAEIAKTAPAGPLEITANVRYPVCNDKMCLPPKKKTASLTIDIDASAPAQSFTIPPDYTQFIKGAPPAPGTSSAAAVPSAESGMLVFLLTAFGLGLAAIFTPCVFPMIPITVSFFLNQRGGIVQASVFSLGIIVLFCALGLGVSAAVGPFGVVQLAANPWVNGFIAAVFCVFALSLLGAFEITLPSSLLTKLDSASRRGGYLGTLLMGLTFALTSFACVGPFVGSLLAASVQTKGAQPILGMASFATGLALPFFLLAAFPSYLKKLPRSGGWLARVKVVMGFILLAAMLKYLSVIDQVMQWNLLTRDRFLAAWFVLFALTGIYLLGVLKFEGVEETDKLGIPRLLTASVFLMFAFSLLPGMFGAQLGTLDAYIPAATQTLGGGPSPEASGPQWTKSDYTQALELAKQQNKPVLVAFTGYACTNCHWMKANMWPRPQIAELLKNFVLVELYTDGTDKESEENQKIEDDRFHTVAIPLYVIFDANGNVL
ncbi:MAG TPA: cytochrome c biogenesis protein CcdA, partial [Bryobacteraceae bacterium]|nr:cytochrome c biogenesis protein CcdA [Bryobacteraceae bacterium]